MTTVSEMWLWSTQAANKIGSKCHTTSGLDSRSIDRKGFPVEEIEWGPVAA